MRQVVILNIGKSIGRKRIEDSVPLLLIILNIPSDLLLTSFALQAPAGSVPPRVLRPSTRKRNSALSLFFEIGRCPLFTLKLMYYSARSAISLHVMVGSSLVLDTVTLND